MKKFGLLVACLVLTIATMAVMTGCNSYSESDSNYYFSSQSKELIDYDEEESNIDEAGFYYYFTSKVNKTVTINISISFGSLQYMYLYVNDVQVESYSDASTIYTHSYQDLELKSGDKLVFHVASTNMFALVESEPDMQIFSINDCIISDLSSISSST